MKFCALVSGGKDSIYSIMEAVKNGHELVCCAHLAPPPDIIESNSFMFQSAASSALPILIEECLGVPLVIHSASLSRKAINTTSNYTGAIDDDEVEDMYDLLVDVQKRFEEVTAISCGALFSNYQRVRVEHVCSRLNLTPLSFLWRMPQRFLLDAMIEDGVHAILVKVAAPGLMPRRHLNKDLASLRSHFHSLHEKFKFHICGEGGEYESLVLDSPLFNKRLVLDEFEIVFPDGDESNSIDEVGVLMIKKCHAEEKLEQHVNGLMSSLKPLSERISYKPDSLSKLEVECNINEGPPKLMITPHLKQCSGGLFHLSGVMSPKAAEATLSEGDAAVQEMVQIFNIVEVALRSSQMSQQDVVFVHLYLSQISHFALINKYYKEFFGSVLPPSRSCVAIGDKVLPGGRRVLLDLCAQKGSSVALRKGIGNSFHNKLREVLHVQGISYWAPVCVGPYSQLNAIRGGVLLLAGQIGLEPARMSLISGGWEAQLEQAWRNAASVLDAFSEGQGGNLKHCMGALVYISSSIVQNNAVLEKAKSLSFEAIVKNAGVKLGFVDGLENLDDSLFDGYEDEETAKEMQKVNLEESHFGQDDIPVLVVAIPEMPMGALSEVELVCLSNKAYKTVGISTINLETTLIRTATSACHNFPDHLTASTVAWDCGYNENFSRSCEILNEEQAIHVDGSVRFANKCCGIAWINVTTKHMFVLSNINLDIVLNEIASKIYESSKKINLTPNEILHLRLYYNRSIFDSDGIDIQSTMRAILIKYRVPCTVIPVVLGSTKLFAAHAMICDLEHMETEMWIDNTRVYY